MFFKIVASLFAMLVAMGVHAQVSVERNFNLELAEKDSITSLKIEQSLNAFLSEAQKREFSEDYIDSTHLLKYEFFFSKISGIGSHSDFHAPLVLKSYPVGNGTFRLTIGFTGEKDGQAFIYQVTELKAVPFQDHYRFYCPFEENTRHFKSKTIENVTYYFSHAFNEVRANEFVEFTQELSRLTHGPTPTLEYYSFNSLDELLKSYGFLYSAKQCNFICYDLGFTDNGGNTYITGTDNENYVFGYIGDYLYYHLPDREDIYWPYVQGLSAYYGGYGLSYDDLDEMKAQFRNKLRQNPQIDFLEEFKKGRKSSINRHFSFYVMSAFLFEKALREKGFDQAFGLVYSGNDGERFFEALDHVLNVNEANFHETILDILGDV